MFSKLAIYAPLALPVFAAATTTPVARNDGGSGSATTACCDSTEPVSGLSRRICVLMLIMFIVQANSAAGTAILKAIGVDLSDVNALLGLTCSPINVIGVGGNSCSANPVCCSDNSHVSIVPLVMFFRSLTVYQMQTGWPYFHRLCSCQLGALNGQ